MEKLPEDSVVQSSAFASPAQQYGWGASCVSICLAMSKRSALRA